MAVAFALPLRLESRFPLSEFKRRFDNAGITGDYPGLESGLDYQLVPKRTRYSVGVKRSGDIRERKNWAEYQRWQADMMVRMKPIVDAVW